MKSKWLPTFPLHAANWLADPRVQMLGPALRTELLEALLRSWMLGKAVAVSPKIAEAYGELWPEYEAVLRDHTEAYERRAERAKKAARGRWDDAPSMPQACSEHAPSIDEPCDAPRKEPQPQPEPQPYPEPEPKPEPVVGRRGTRLPDDAVLSGEWVEIADRHGVENVDAVFLEFVNYWTSLPGPKARKLDWKRTWENQCIRVGTGVARSRMPTTAAERSMANVRSMLERVGAA